MVEGHRTKEQGDFRTYHAGRRARNECVTSFRSY